MEEKAGMRKTASKFQTRIPGERKQKEERAAKRNIVNQCMHFLFLFYLLENRKWQLETHTCMVKKAMVKGILIGKLIIKNSFLDKEKSKFYAGMQ